MQVGQADPGLAASSSSPQPAALPFHDLHGAGAHEPAFTQGAPGSKLETALADKKELSVYQTFSVSCNQQFSSVGNKAKVI